MQDFTGKVVLITGAAGPGIGGACAREFASRGASIVLSDRSSGRTEAAATELSEGSGVPVLPVTMDVSDETSVTNGVERAIGEFGRVDVLVNNAAVVHRKPIVETSVDSWSTVLGVCLTGAFLTLRACLPGMFSRQSGAIVNIASVAAWTGPADDTASYSAAKSGLLGLTRAAASEAGPHNVRVNAVAPGLVPNPAIQHLFDADWIDGIRRSTPLRRAATPDDIARAVVFLAGDHSTYITGEVITVSGGFYYHA